MIWLLDLTWAGRVFRFASEPVTLVDADGVSLPYAGGLVPDYSVGAPIGEIQSDLEVDLGELVFPVDVALWHRQGRPLLGCAAELSTWVSGTWETRSVRLSGVVSAAEVGTAGDPVKLVLRWVLPAGPKVTPAVVSLTAWSTAAADAVGRSYPTVLGRPGIGSTATEMLPSTGGSPVSVVSTTGNGTGLVAGHYSAATSVLVVDVTDPTAPTSASLAASNQVDGSGRPCTTVAGTAPFPLVAGRTYWADWASTDGGAYRADSATAVRTAGDWLLWLLVRTPGADLTAWGAVASMLGGYALDGYIDDDVAPMGYIEDAILPLLPLSAVPGPTGLVPVLWRLDAAAGDVALVEGEGVARAGRLSLDLGGVRNSITVRYAPRADDGQSSGEVTADSTTHAACAASVTYLPESAETLDTAIVYSESTARHIAAWRATAYALPVERVRYVDLAGLDLQPGDVVSLTDSDLHLSARVAHIGAVTYKGASVEYDVLIFTVPGRDTLAT